MPGSGKEKSRAEVGNLVAHRTEGLWAAVEPNSPNNPVFLLWDDWYYLPSAGEARNLVRRACQSLPAYFGEAFDCDDFAFLVRGRAAAYAADRRWSRLGLCMGIVTAHCAWVSEYHVACWLLYWDAGEGEHKLTWIDPQECRQDDGTKPLILHPPGDVERIRTMIG